MTDAYGRNIPGDDETPDLPKAFEDFSLSMPPGPLPVSSITQANAIRAAAGNPSTMHVWNTTTNQELRWNGTGWEYVAGRQHGATVNFRREGIAEGGVGLLHATSFVRASAGWTINGNAWLVIPQTGMYLFTIDYNIEGTAGALGRSYFQLTLRGGGAEGTGLGFRVPATNENHWGGTVMWPMTAGNEIQIRGYAEGGGTRTHNAIMQVAMINAPNW